MYAQTLLIRCDVSPKLSPDTIPRCIAIAREWQQNGGAVCFASHNLPVPLRRQLVNEEGFSLCLLGSQPGTSTDLLETIAAIRNQETALVIVAGGHLRAAYRKSLESAGVRVLLLEEEGQFFLPEYQAELRTA